MPNTVQQFVEEYTAALHEYLSHRDEAALQHVYELGRRALAEGAGVLEMVERHHKALASVLLHQRTPQETASAVRSAAELLSESLSPFEMTYRGFQNSIHLLTQLSETLEQRVAERTAELQQMKEKYAGIFENAIEGIFLTTPEGRFLNINRAMAQKFGYESSQELMTSVVDVERQLYVDPGRREEFTRLMEKQGYVWEFEVEVYRKDRSMMWISANARTVRDAQGNRYYQGFVIDITDRKRAEAALQERARQQAVVAELGQRALAGTELSVLMNEAATRVAKTLGVEYSKLLELMPDGSALLLRAGVGWREGLVGQAMVSAGSDSQAGYTLLSGDPVIVNDLRTDARFRGHMLLHDHGIVSGISVIIQTQERPFGVLTAHTSRAREFTQDDVNFLQSMANVLAMAIHRKQAEQALKDSEMRYHTLVDGIRDYEIFLLDADGRVISWNTGAERGKGYRAEEIIGQHFSRFFTPEDNQWNKADTVLQTAAAETRYEEEGWRVRKDGSRYWGNIVIAALRDDQGQLRGFSVVTRDITERKLGEQQLKESREQLHSLSSHLLSVREEERSAIAREIHDEFAQSLTGLKMDLSWLAARLPPNQPTLFEKAKTMAKLIDTTVQSVRKIVGKLRPGLLDDLGLIAALEWYANDFQTRTGMQCKFTSRLTDLHLDRERSTAVFRIFQESLTNVTRHANATKVAAKLNVSGGDLILEVKDNGRGITDAELSNQKSFGLLGMRERAYLLGGEVQIRGRAGKGTTVTVQIPIERSERT